MYAKPGRYLSGLRLAMPWTCAAVAVCARVPSEGLAEILAIRPLLGGSPLSFGSRRARNAVGRPVHRSPLAEFQCGVRVVAATSQKLDKRYAESDGRLRTDFEPGIRDFDRCACACHRA